MTRSSYNDAFKQAKEEFDALHRERDAVLVQLKEIDARIVQIRRGVIALAALAGEDIDDVALGLTDSIRALLSGASAPLTTQQVISGISELGFDVSSHKNPTASITAVLNRLAENKEIVRQNKSERHPGGVVKSKIYWCGPKVQIATP